MSKFRVFNMSQNLKKLAFRNCGDDDDVMEEETGQVSDGLDDLAEDSERLPKRAKEQTRHDRLFEDIGQLLVRMEPQNGAKASGGKEPARQVSGTERGVSRPPADNTQGQKTMRQSDDPLLKPRETSTAGVSPKPSDPVMRQGRGRLSELSDSYAFLQTDPYSQYESQGGYGGKNPGPDPTYGWDPVPAPRQYGARPRGLAADAAEARAKEAGQRGVPVKQAGPAGVARVSFEAGVAQNSRGQQIAPKTAGAGPVSAPRRNPILYHDSTVKLLQEHAQKHLSIRNYALNKDASQLRLGIDSEYIRFLTNMNPQRRVNETQPPVPWHNEQTFRQLPEAALEGRDGHWISFVVRTDVQSSVSAVDPLTAEEMACIKSYLPLRTACLNVAKRWLKHWGLTMEFETSQFTIANMEMFKNRLGTPGNHNNKRMTRFLRFMRIFFENTAVDLLVFLLAHIRNGPLSMGMLDVKEDTILFWHSAVYDAVSFRR